MKHRYSLRCVIILLLFLGTGISPVLAQDFSLKDFRRHIRRGNNYMHQGEREKAIAEYKASYEKDTTSILAAYNLATSLFDEKWKGVSPKPEIDSTMAKMDKLFSMSAFKKDTPHQLDALYDLGVLHQLRAGQVDSIKTKELQQAIEYYKQVLRRNPHDDKARYNLVLCQRQLPKGNGGNNQDQDKKDNNQDDQKQEQQKQDEQKQDEQKDEQKNEQEQQQNPDQQNIEQ